MLMMGERTVAQEQLFYGFSLERHIPADHLLRAIDRFVDLSELREELRPFYSDTGRPSIDPELMIRCPGGSPMRTTGTLVNDGATLIYRASKHDCGACALKPRCCPKEPQRKVTRSIHEGARDRARDLAKTDAWLISRRQRKKVEMLFAHLKRILKLDRLRLRGPCGARDEFHLAAAAQNLRKMAKLIGGPSPITA
jgi:hypothetical protein